MKFMWTSAIVFVALAVAPSIAAAESSGAHVGEVRLFAVARGDRAVVAQLQDEGWVDVNGQLLDVDRYGELYRRIGRTWTADGVAANRFAVPRLEDSTQPTRSSDNPFGVLGHGDVLSSGRVRPVTSRRSPLSYWIFAGRHAASTASGAPREQR
jgi:microcystin-dependent protein